MGSRLRSSPPPPFPNFLEILENANIRFSSGPRARLFYKREEVFELWVQVRLATSRPEPDWA